METRTQKALGFAGVDIVHIHFDPSQLYKEGESIDIGIDAKLIKRDEEEGLFDVIMAVQISSKEYFDLEIHALGHFKVDNSIEKEKRANLVNVNAPAIMFPYVRAFISSLTAQCGRSISPIILPPQFFSGTLEELQ